MKTAVAAPQTLDGSLAQGAFRLPATVLTRLALPQPLGRKVGAPVRAGVPVVMRSPGGVVCTSCRNSRMRITIRRETAGSRC